MGFILGTIGMHWCGGGAILTGSMLGAKWGSVLGPKGSLVGAVIGGGLASTVITVIVAAPI